MPKSTIMLTVIFIWLITLIPEYLITTQAAPLQLTPTPEPTVIWPTLISSEPTSPQPGQTVEVVGYGGYLQYKNGYDERSRDFALYLDEQEIGTLNCYVNYCQGNITLADNTTPGNHYLSVEGGSTLTMTVVSDTTALPDLIISHVGLQQSGGTGCYIDHITYEDVVIVANIGTASATKFVVESAGTQHMVDGLAANESIQLIFPTGGLPAVDVTKLITESDETNNHYLGSFVTPTPPPTCTPTFQATSMMSPTPTALGPQPTVTPTPSPQPTITPTPTMLSGEFPDLTITDVYTILEGGNCYVDRITYQAQVYVKNIGTGQAGPFVVAAGGQEQRVTNGLDVGESISLRFPFDSHPVVDLYNDVLEHSEINNRYIGPLVTPSPPPTCTPTTKTMTPPAIPGDVDHNGQVDILDLSLIATYYGQSNHEVDLNNDGIINIFDLSIAATNYQ